MGYYKDLGSGTVAKIADELTGFPVDQWGHLLDPSGAGKIAIDQELPNLTNPYGFLEFAIGNGDDFLCMDYTTIRTTFGSIFLIVDTTYNSESSGYIGGVSYDVHPINNDKEKIEALRDVREMLNANQDGEVQHSKSGWNQDERYFLRAIARNLFPDKFSRCSERMIRMGGKTSDGAIAAILKGE